MRFLLELLSEVEYLGKFGKNMYRLLRCVSSYFVWVGVEEWKWDVLFFVWNGGDVYFILLWKFG